MGRTKEKEEETTLEEMCHMINTSAKEILGETSCGKYVEKESWWWNDEVQKAAKMYGVFDVILYFVNPTF